MRWSAINAPQMIMLFATNMIKMNFPGFFIPSGMKTPITKEKMKAGMQRVIVKNVSGFKTSFNVFMPSNIFMFSPV